MVLVSVIYPFSTADFVFVTVTVYGVAVLSTVPTALVYPVICETSATL